jgi:hypothetical protein
MPSRRRPPLTAREIGAYFAGRRLARLWLDNQAESPTRAWVLAHLAAEDAEILAAMSGRRFFAWLDRGWDDEVAGDWA